MASIEVTATEFHLKTPIRLICILIKLPCVPGNRIPTSRFPVIRAPDVDVAIGYMLMTPSIRWSIYIQCRSKVTKFYKRNLQG